MFTNKFSAALAVMMFASVVSTSLVSAQERYALTLDNNYVNKLRANGSLFSPIGDESQNKIRTIELKYDDTKSRAPVELDLNVATINGDAVIVLDDELLAKIKGQPVRTTVSDSQFTRVLLKYEAPMMSADPAIESAMSGEGMIFIRMSDTETMSGKLDGISEFKMACRFGDVTIPMDQIAGIRFHTNRDDSAVVVLSNGDSITGTPTVPAVKLMTDWGSADIEPEFIQSLTMSSGAKFRQANSDFGSRWELKTGTSYAPGPMRNN